MIVSQCFIPAPCHVVGGMVRSQALGPGLSSLRYFTLGSSNKSNAGGYISEILFYIPQKKGTERGGKTTYGTKFGSMVV